MILSFYLCLFISIFYWYCFIKRENLIVNYLLVQLQSTWKCHLILVEDLEYSVHDPVLKEKDKWEGILLWRMSKSCWSCQIDELSTFLEDLGNQSDINCKVITVSVICIYFNCGQCTVFCIQSLRNIFYIYGNISRFKK